MLISSLSGWRQNCLPRRRSRRTNLHGVKIYNTIWFFF